MPNLALLIHVAELRDLRSSLAIATATVAERQAAFDRDNAGVLAEKKRLAALVVEREAEIRTLAGGLFAVTKDPALCPGVVVKMFKRLSYDAARAFAWAKETKLALVPEQLDKKSFEKVASATTLDFVTYSSEPQIQIATDLDKALAGLDLPAVAEPAAVETPAVSPTVASTPADASQAADASDLDARIEALFQ